MINHKQEWKNIVSYTSIAFIISFVMIYFIYYMYSFAPFGDMSLACDDAQIQYLDFFLNYRNVLLGNMNISYTLSDTLGGDMLSYFAYYLASPLNLLVVFFEPSNLINFFHLLIAIKLSLSAATMSIFIKIYFGKDINSIFTLILSLSYAFMQFNIAQASNIMWLDGVYMLPLMILGVHNAVRNKKITCLSISTALCILFNWYAAGLCCLFTIIWFLFESILVFMNFPYKNMKLRWINVLKGTISYGGGMVIAVFMSAILFLPTVFSLLSGKGLDSVIDFNFTGNMLSIINNYHIGGISSKGNPSLYCGCLVLIGIIGLFCLDVISKQKKLLYMVLLFASTFMYFFEPYNLIFSLFRQVYSYYYRYSFVSIFAMVCVAAKFYSLIESKQWNKKLRYVMGFPFLLLLLQYIRSTVDIKYIYLTIFAFLAIFVVIFLYVKENRIERQRIVSVILIAGVCFELFLNVKTLWINRYSNEDSYYRVYQEEQNQQIEEIKASDDGMYRISQTIRRINAGYNESLAYNYWSNTGYTSCPENIQLDFLDRLGYRCEGSCITVVNTSVLAADSLLGVKYVLSNSEINGLELRTEFGEHNNKQVYENPYCLPMNFLVDEFNEQTENTENPFEYHNSLYSQLLGRKIDLYEKIDYKTIKQEDGILYTLVIPSGNYGVYGNIPYEGWVNGTLVCNDNDEISYANWLSSSVFYIPTKNNEMTAKVHLSADDYAGFSEPQFYALNLDVLGEVTDELSDQPVTDIVLGNDEIDYEIEIDTAKYLYLSIPYSEGWKIKINGEIVDPLLLGDCMMVLPLEKGKNVIDMDYTIPGLYEGIALTVIGIIIFLVWITVVRNKKLSQRLYNFITSRAMRYIIVGGCTTMVNLIVFTILCKICYVNVNMSNIISIICAILFAYVANKIFVFKSKCITKKDVLVEMAKFVGARISTMIIEVGGVLLLYNIMCQDELIAKLETQIIVLVVNYFISKFFVFKTKEEK